MRLKYQNESGIVLSRSRSDLNHCTTHRVKNRPCPRKPMVSQMVSVALIAFPVAVPQAALLHPSDGDQVIEALEQAIADAVLRLAVGAGIMMNRDLD